MLLSKLSVRWPSGMVSFRLDRRLGFRCNFWSNLFGWMVWLWRLHLLRLGSWFLVVVDRGSRLFWRGRFFGRGSGHYRPHKCGEENQACPRNDINPTHWTIPPRVDGNRITNSASFA